MTSEFNWSIFRGAVCGLAVSVTLTLGGAPVAFAQGGLSADEQAIPSPLTPPQDDTVQFVEEQQRQTAPIAIAQGQSAEKALRDFMRKKNWRENWDNKKNRTMVIATASEKISSTDPDFMEKREFLAIEALLMGKAKIIESFLTTASASNILSVPGNPIAKQVEKEQKQIRAELEKARKNLALAQKDAALLAEAVDQQTADELAGVTESDRKGRLFDAIIRKIDASYQQGELAAEKKQRLDDLKKRLELARDAESKAAELEAEIQGKIDELQGSIKKELKSSVETLSDMPIFGATVVQQIESYDELNERFEMSLLVVWSQKLENEARSILLNEQGAKTSDSDASEEFYNWVNSKDLSHMVGPRRFKASDGTIYFMGISAMAYDPDYDDRADVATEVEAWAKQQAILSVTGDMRSFKKFEKVKQEIRNAAGRTDTKFYKDASRELSNEVKDVQMRGLEVLAPLEMTHPASGRNILVTVGYINSALSAQAGDLLADTFATLREFNAEQSIMKGEVQGMRDKAAETKDNQALYQQGYKQGGQAVQGTYDQRARERAQSGAPASSASGGAAAGSGTWGDDTVEDDF